MRYRSLIAALTIGLCLWPTSVYAAKSQAADEEALLSVTLPNPEAPSDPDDGDLYDIECEKRAPTIMLALTLHRRWALDVPLNKIKESLNESSDLLVRAARCKIRPARDTDYALQKGLQEEIIASLNIAVVKLGEVYVIIMRPRAVFQIYCRLHCGLR